MGTAENRYQVDLSQEPDRSLRRAEKIQLGDLDGDGVVELLMASPLTKQVFVVHRPSGENANEVPKAEVLLEDSQWGAPNAVLAWDLNGDGMNDLLIPEQIDQGRILIYHAQQDGGYKMAPPIVSDGLDGVRQLTIARANDGKALMLAANEGGLTLYDISGNPSLHDNVSEYPKVVIRYKIPEVSPKLELTDVDNDGHLDAVVGRASSSAQAGNVWIAYGPLWERFADLNKKDFVLQ